MIVPDTIIGSRYQVIKQIGAGGMQDVYLVKDVLMDHFVALKTPQLGQQTKRFQVSAVIAGRVNHHNVAKTLDYFEEDKCVYLIEEFIDGETLEDTIRKRSFLDPHLAAKVFHLLAKGISASHQQGVIHRDLKPSNVMVGSDDSISFLKITDFGIATLTEEVFDEAAESGDITRSTSGTVRGALPYMAPEMMFRKPNDLLTCAMDIWSIGAMMFKILTGEYPFGVYLQAAVNVQNKNREDWPDFMTKNLQFSPLARELQSLVDDCLTYDPLNRPTAEDLVTRCQNLCYLNSERNSGTVRNLIQNGYSGFADNNKHTVFFSMESVYGKVLPNLNSRISYSSFAGEPRERAHPVIVLN